MRILIAIVSLLVPFSIWADDAESVINIQHWQTKNGANVYFVRAPEIPMVDIQVVFAAGSSFDGKQWGLASLVNSLLGEGTTKQNADQIAVAFDRIGAEFDSNVDRDMASASLRSLTKPVYLKPALKTFAAVLTTPSFSAKAFNRVKQQQLSGIEYNEQSPTSVASRAFYHKIYGTHPYGHSPDGTLESVKALTKKEVKAFYHRYYVAKNADVVIVGDLTREQAQHAASQVVGSLPSGKPAPRLSNVKIVAQSLYQRIPFPAKQNTIVIGQVAIKPTSPNYFSLMVGNRILGGLPLSSILFEQVRNQRGLAYAAYSDFSPLKYGGPFSIALQTRTDKANEALKITQNVLQQFVNQGPTQTQLEAAKKNIIGAFPLQLSTNADVLANVTNIVFYHLPLNYLNTYRGKVRAVTAAQIKAAFQKTIHPKKMAVIVVGS